MISSDGFVGCHILHLKKMKQYELITKFLVKSLIVSKEVICMSTTPSNQIMGHFDFSKFTHFDTC
jgi:hypothetical protein